MSNASVLILSFCGHCRQTLLISLYFKQLLTGQEKKKKLLQSAHAAFWSPSNCLYISSKYESQPEWKMYTSHSVLIILKYPHPHPTPWRWRTPDRRGISLTSVRSESTCLAGKIHPNAAVARCLMPALNWAGEHLDVLHCCCLQGNSAITWLCDDVDFSLAPRCLSLLWLHFTSL